jgi:ribonuclease HI
MTSRIPSFLIEKEKFRRAKNTVYSVFLTLAPEQSQIFFGPNAWTRAENFMKGKPHTHKGFTNQIDARKWMADQNKFNVTPAGLQHESPKEDARALYPERVAKARNAGRMIYNTDCSYERGKSCGTGVWSRTGNLQLYVQRDFLVVNHQRGELLAVLDAFRHYESVMLKDPESKGITIFTDSEYSERTINCYSRRYKKHRGANIWFNSKNRPVKHQDVIEDILRIRTDITLRHRFVEVLFIPRELNMYADAVSRGKLIQHSVAETGTEKWTILE